MTAILTFLIRYLPTIIGFLTTLAGLIGGGGAVGSHFKITANNQQLVASGLSASANDALYSTHVVGQGSAAAAVLLAGLAVGYFGQSRINSWKSAFEEKQKSHEIQVARAQAWLESQQHRADVINQVHDLPVNDLLKVLSQAGGTIQKFHNGAS